jgi:hypothetical protein
MAWKLHVGSRATIIGSSPATPTRDLGSGFQLTWENLESFVDRQYIYGPLGLFVSMHLLRAQVWEKNQARYECVMYFLFRNVFFFFLLFSISLGKLQMFNSTCLMCSHGT